MSSTHPSRALLLTGIAGPVVFGSVVVVNALLRPGYDHVDQFISELGETGGEFAWLMNHFGFMLSAMLILVFVLTFRLALPRTILNVVGTIFLAVFATCLFLAGVFSCDTGCPTTGGSSEQQLHDLVSVIAFPAFIVGVSAWGVQFLRAREWRLFGVYSLLTSASAVGLLVIMVESEATRDGTGLYQRLFLAVLFLWLIVLAGRLLRSASESPAATTGG